MNENIQNSKQLPYKGSKNAPIKYYNIVRNVGKSNFNDNDIIELKKLRDDEGLPFSFIAKLFKVCSKKITNLYEATIEKGLTTVPPKKINKPRGLFVKRLKLSKQD